MGYNSNSEGKKYTRIESFNRRLFLLALEQGEIGGTIIIYLHRTFFLSTYCEVVRRKAKKQNTFCM